MNRPMVWMFSGQGSQYDGMGRQLYAEERTFREWVDCGDVVVKSELGFSLTETLYGRATDRRIPPLVKTIHSHPALYVLQYALAQTVMGKGMQPQYVLGYSLGEFVAHSVAGTISYEEGLRAVIRQAQVLEATCPCGGMLAILDSLDVLRRFPGFSSVLEIAAVNSSEHFVVSGQEDSVQKFHAVLRDAEVSSVILPVEFAYHSSHINQVVIHDRLSLPEPRRPIHYRVVSSAYSGFVNAIEREYFGTVIRLPVRFDKTVRFLESMGEHLYLDLGPSGTLANFVVRNLAPSSRSRGNAIMTPFGLDEAKLNALLSKVSGLSKSLS